MHPQQGAPVISSHCRSVITCIKIYSHTSILRVGVRSDVQSNHRKINIVAEGNNANLQTKLKRHIDDNFPELAFLSSVDADCHNVDSNSNSFLTCVKVNSSQSICRMLVDGEHPPVYLLIPAEVSAAEKDRIKRRVENEFPEVSVVESERTSQKNCFGRLGVVGGLVGIALLYLTLRQVRGDLDRHLHVVAASMAAIASSVDRSVNVWESKGCPAMANINVSIFKSALW